MSAALLIARTDVRQSRHEEIDSTENAPCDDYRRGLRLKTEGKDEEAMAVFGRLVENPEAGVWGRKALGEMRSIDGSGELGGRFEYLLGRLFRDALDPGSIAAMIGASLLGQFVGIGVLSRLLQTAPQWHSRGLGARMLARTTSFAAETLGFSIAGKLFHPGRPSDFGGDLQRSVLTLGAFRLFGAAGKGFKIYQAPAGQQVAALLGVYSAHRLEEAFGLAKPSPHGLVDALGAWMALEVGASLAYRVLGGRFAQKTATLQWRAREEGWIPGRIEGKSERLAWAGGMSAISAPDPKPRFANAPMMMSTGSGDPKMKGSYEIAASIVLEKQRPGNREALERIGEKDLLVVAGQYDQIENVLRPLKIPFRIVSPGMVSSTSLEGARCVFVNCGSGFPRSGARALGRWVEAGGMMMSTDWCLSQVLEVAFWDGDGRLYVRFNGQATGKKNPEGLQRPELVDITEYNKDDGGITGYWGHGDPRWWLEPSSQPIQVLAPSVEVLARARELGKRYGEDPVVVRFPHGQGRVIHLISHFELQHAGPRAGQNDASASAYVTSLGLSPAVIEQATRIESRSGAGESESSVRAATASLGLIVDTITRSVGPAGLRIPASSSGFVWRGEGKLWKFQDGWKLAVPPGSGTVIIGRAGDALIVDRRASSDISRRHAMLQESRESIGPQFKLSALDNEVTILRVDGQTVYLKGRRGSVGDSAPIWSGDRVRLTPDVEFVFEPKVPDSEK